MSYSILIGRFQPFHHGHYELLKEALRVSDKLILVLGSCNKPISDKNPWTAEQRKQMISLSIQNRELEKSNFVLMDDHESDADWLAAMRSEILKIAGRNSELTLVGHLHDASGYYLKLFPEWKFHNLNNFDQFPHATQLREWIKDNNDNYKQFINSNILDLLK